MLSIPILQTIAHSNRWTTCTLPSESGTGGTARPILLFTDHRHPGTLRLTFDGDSAILLSLDPPRDLAAAFPCYTIDPDTHSLRLPIDPPKGNDLLLRLPSVLTALADLASTDNPAPPSATETAPATEREQIVLARSGQGVYRERLLDLWGNACAVTGLANPAFLRASHAKPWADATAAERLDPANGLPLVPNLDHLFDGGWISFADDGTILLSPALDPSQAALLGVTPSLRLRLPLSPAQQSYLSIHRARVFRPHAVPHDS